MAVGVAAVRLVMIAVANRLIRVGVSGSCQGDGYVDVYLEGLGERGSDRFGRRALRWSQDLVTW